MKDQFKFRAYDLDKKKIFFPVCIRYEFKQTSMYMRLNRDFKYGRLISNDFVESIPYDKEGGKCIPNSIVSMCTNLKDCKGNLIYEHDVVSIKTTKSSRWKCYILFCSEIARFKLFFLNKDIITPESYGYSWDDFVESVKNKNVIVSSDIYPREFIK